MCAAIGVIMCLVIGGIACKRKRNREKMLAAQRAMGGANEVLVLDPDQPYTF